MIVILVEVVLSNRRYHIHVVCAVYDQTLVLDGLAVFFQKRAFLTYDISRNLPQAALYGRQCIDASDYIVVVVGDSYGETQNLGVSQMHLSYLSAKAKLKPMLILIKNQVEGADISRKLKDFTRLVEQHPNHIYYYDEQTNIEQLLMYAYHDMTKNYPLEPSWVKEDTRLKTATTPSSERPSYKKPLPLKENKTPQSAPTTKDTNTQTLMANAETDTDQLTTSLVLTDTFEVRYSAQAYEGGNLSDVTLSMNLTWQEILEALAKIPAAFSGYGLQSCLNRLIAAKAEQDIKKIMPNVHAVARCQIAPQDLSKMQCLLVAANWIQMHAVSTHSSQELWKLTFFAKQIFADLKVRAL